MTAQESRIEQTLRDSPVIVTGAAGFVGSHLVNKLVDIGARVHAFIRPVSSGVPNLADVMSSIEIHHVNLTDPYAVRTAVRSVRASDAGPISVFHLGAQAHVGESWQRPVETFNDNVFGTLHLLRAILDEAIDVRCIDIAGTSEEFGNPDPALNCGFTLRDNVVLFSSSSPVNPQSPYATSKVAADYLGRNFYSAYGLPVLTTRMFNNFGPRQSARYFTPTVITQALTREEVLIGNVDATRDYTYVADGVWGHINAACFGEPGGTYVFGYGEQIDNRSWAELILRVGEEEGFWKNRELAVDEARVRPGSSEVQRLGVDYNEFQELTGWKPSTQRRYGIAETIRFYHDHPDAWRGMTDW